ncbi:MFS transporter [Niabella ginsengisoli]|uniref:MFS transporter n=1 Tax=Niabella ginsengisoli TaxID=522298 RepID=A0ABS9SLB8_9BACT|nr:hypothetical protein [Niabella ginsengisoli]MCH5599160.1 hypothetical protein [Niabella ginsengisoli]
MGNCCAVFYVGAQVCILSSIVLFAIDVVTIAESDAKWYSFIAGLAFMAGRFVGTFFMRFVKPRILLGLYAIICVGLCAVSILASGIITLYAMIGIAFFMSIMFPTIFALGIAGIGPDTKSGSSLIVMSIVGGAILPPILGWIGDATHNLQYGYIVPLICFVFIAWYAKVGVKADIKDDELQLGGGH